MIRLLRICLPIRIVGLFTSESALFSVCFILACWWYVDTDVQTYLAGGGLARIGIVAVAFLITGYLSDAYSSVNVQSTALLISRVMVLMGAVLFWEAAVGYADPYWALPRSVSVAGALAALVVLSTWRLIYTKSVTASLGAESILFIGDAPLVFSLSREFQQRPEIGMRPIGYIADQRSRIDELPHLGPMSEVSSIVRELKPDRVIIGCSERRGQLPVNALLDLRFSGFLFTEAASVYEEAFGRVCVDEIRPSHLILSTRLGPRRRTVRLQTIYSVPIALIGLVAAAPLLAIAAVLIRLTSRGPVFYRQTRVGLHGKTFQLYKLRSMCEDAEAGTGAIWAAQNDPRVTAVGRVLRKTRIDELPQFWNVLKGEMSIVGPRPERPEFVKNLTEQIPFYPQRHCVKPGITGWAQIRHQYGDSLGHARTKLEYDLYYIKNLSAALDLYIMLQTAKIMLLSRGAR